MKIIKQVLLGEVIYVVSNFEKGRCTTTKLWTKKYKNSLLSQISNLQYYIKMLSETTDCIQKEFIDSVLSTLNNKVIIDEYILKSLVSGNYEIEDGDYDFNYTEVNDFMMKIIDEIVSLINKPNGKYKNKIWLLLHALHNLPKVYLSKDNGIIIKHTNKISYSDAMECANSYFIKCENL